MNYKQLKLQVIIIRNFKIAKKNEVWIGIMPFHYIHSETDYLETIKIMIISTIILLSLPSTSSNHTYSNQGHSTQTNISERDFR